MTKTSKKAIVMLMMLMVSVNVFAAKIVVDQPTNDTYAQQKSDTEWDLIKEDEELGYKVATMLDIIATENLSEDFSRKFVKAVDEFNKANDSFNEYKHVLWDVEDGKLPANAYSQRVFIYRFNQVAHNFNKVLKLFKNR